jgi:hypothetical protein
MANDFRLEIPILVKNRSLFGMGSNDILVTDIRQMQRKLKEIDPDLRKQLLRDAKEVGSKAATIIERAIPQVSPLRASNSRGRLGWETQVNNKGQRLAANKTSVQFRTSGSGRSATTSLVAVKVLAPMTIIADIAGRSGRQINKGYRGSGFTREFDRNGIQVRMRLNGQGNGMIKKLGSGASRFAWPALIQDKPRLEAEVRAVIDRYTQIANRGYK